MNRHDGFLALQRGVYLLCTAPSSYSRRDIQNFQVAVYLHSFLIIGQMLAEKVILYRNSFGREAGSLPASHEYTTR